MVDLTIAWMDKSVIALIGPSGSGKSSLGFKLALRLKWQFLDTDSEIERLLQQTVTDIFQNLGESEFRKQECLLVENFAKANARNLVLSTGGGLPVFGANWEMLESFATIIYLTAPLEVLVTRISCGKPRPLLAGAGTDAKRSRDNQIEIRLGKLIAERESIYNRARYKIDTSKANVDQLADDIIRLTGLVLPSGS